MQLFELSMWGLLISAVTAGPTMTYKITHPRSSTPNSNRVSDPHPLPPETEGAGAAESFPHALPAVTERQALDAFIGAVAMMRQRNMPIPTLLDFADIQARNTVPGTPNPDTQIA